MNLDGNLQALSRRTRVQTRPLQLRNGRKQMECPRCRMQCSVKGGRAAELPTNYDVMGT